MTTHTSAPAQTLPTPFAERLQSLRDVDNALLNVMLAAARDVGWHAPALAAGLQMKAPAVNKRVQRARKNEAEARNARSLRRATRGGSSDALQAWGRIQARVQEYERVRAALAREDIPRPPEVHAMANGKRLDADRIAQLRRMQQVTSRVRGSTPADHEDREVSKQLAALLHQLNTVEGYSAYYLGKVMGVSTRAVTSRLERHTFRDPCPSVDGTASGRYFGRKIGDPGIGAPRLDRQQRQALRALWSQYRVLDGPARERAHEQLVAGLRKHLNSGFTLANLAQAMSTPSRRIRFNELRAVLARPAGAEAAEDPQRLDSWLKEHAGTADLTDADKVFFADQLRLTTREAS